MQQRCSNASERVTKLKGSRRPELRGLRLYACHGALRPGVLPAGQSKFKQIVTETYFAFEAKRETIYLQQFQRKQNFVRKRRRFGIRVYGAERGTLFASAGVSGSRGGAI